MTELTETTEPTPETPVPPKARVHFATVNEGALYHALSMASALQKGQGRTTSQFYKQVQLIPLGTILILRATDLDLSLTCDIPMEAGTSGTGICVDTGKLLALLTPKGARTLTLYVENSLLQVEIDGITVATLPTFPVTDFPLTTELQANPETTHLTRPYSAWRRPLELLSHCMSKDETRLNLNGLWFGTQTEVAGTKRKKRPLPQETEWCATDGHRMVVTKDDPEWEGGFPTGVIIPRLGVEMILKLVAQPKRGSATMDPMATLSQNPTQDHYVFLKAGNCQLAIRTIDGDFPNYTQIVPSQPATYILTVHRETFLAALKQFKGIAKTVKGITLTWEKGYLLTLSMKDGAHTSMARVRTANDFAKAPRRLSTVKMKEAGLTHKDLEKEAAAVTSFSIGFNRHSLVDLLTALPGDDVIIRFTDEVSPGVFANPTDSRTVALIMPMRI